MKRKPPQRIQQVARKPGPRVIHISQEEWMAKLVRENSARMVEVADTFDRAQWIIPRVRKAK